MKLKNKKIISPFIYTSLALTKKRHKTTSWRDLIVLYAVVIVLTISDVIVYASYKVNGISLGDDGYVYISHIQTPDEIAEEAKNTHVLSIVEKSDSKALKEHIASDSELDENVMGIMLDMKSVMDNISNIDCKYEDFIEARQQAGELYEETVLLCKAYENSLYDDMKYLPYAGLFRNISASGGKKSCYEEIVYNKALFDECVNGYTDYYNGYFNLSDVRKRIVDTALSTQGAISYIWGTKPTSKELSQGYDCSGFVQWVYWNAEDSDKPRDILYSTLNITNNAEQISYDELLPGDLGVIREDGSFYISAAGNKFYDFELVQQDNMLIGASPEDYKIDENHVGIYVGKDNEGNDVWCHCRGGIYNTVVVDNYSGFGSFYRVLSSDEQENIVEE